jgi:hypothetical protein
MFQSIGVTDRTQAAVWAQRHGLARTAAHNSLAPGGPFRVHQLAARGAEDLEQARAGDQRPRHVGDRAREIGKRRRAQRRPRAQR